MTNYAVGNSSTQSSVRWGLLTILAASAPALHAAAAPAPSVWPARAWESQQTPSSASFIVVGSAAEAITDEAVVSSMFNVLSDLAARQRPLEPDIAQILFDNIWDLYIED